MENRSSRDPEVAEVLPQHKFDHSSLETYLNQYLPGFDAEPEAKLTVAQYRYLRRPPSPVQTNLCMMLFLLWSWVGSLFILPRFLFL